MHSLEQQARDLLERMGVKDAQSYTAGDVVELANLLNENARLAQEIEQLKIENVRLKTRKWPRFPRGYCPTTQDYYKWTKSR